MLKKDAASIADNVILKIVARFSMAAMIPISGLFFGEIYTLLKDMSKDISTLRQAVTVIDERLTAQRHLADERNGNIVSRILALENSRRSN